MMSRRSTGLLVSLLVGAAIAAAPTQAIGANTKLGLGFATPRVVLRAQPGGGPVTGTLQIRVQATIPAQLQVAPRDAVSDAKGALVSAPFGSTSYSLGPSLTISPAAIDVAASDAEQTFNITVTVRVGASDPPHLGILAVTLFPPGGGSQRSGTAITQGLGMDATVVSMPPNGGEAAVPGATAALAAADITVRRGAPWTPVDQVIPDLLATLVDHGPAEAVVRFTNTGNVILDSTTVFQFASVGPGALLPGNTDAGSPFYTVTQIPRYALPGQITSSDGDSLLRIKDSAPVEMLPLIGVVRITATTTATLGSIAAAPLTQSIVIVVFPWKELLALVLLLVLLRIVRSGLRRAWSRLRGRANTKQQADVQDNAASSAPDPTPQP
jgi:hypothetical protein